MNDPLQPAGGWLDVGARLPAPQRGQRGWAFNLLSRAARFFGRTQVPDVFAGFHINARLFWPWLWFASRLMPGGRLPPRERELVILRTAWNCRSRYEWGQHVEIGLRAGLSDAEIVQLARAPQSFADERARLLLAACDELGRDSVIADATWRALAVHYRPALLIEITILAGHYRMLAGLLNSSGLQLESSIEAALQDFYRRIQTVRA